MHIYHQASGCWRGPSGSIIGVGYSGIGGGLNNPGEQETRDVGPIPAGKYTIGKAYHHPELGPVTMNLEPDPANEMFGRSLFRAHGRKSPGDMTSSHGCIVQDHDARVLIDASEDRDLIVEP